MSDDLKFVIKMLYIAQENTDELLHANTQYKPLNEYRHEINDFVKAIKLVKKSRKV